MLAGVWVVAPPAAPAVDPRRRDVALPGRLGRGLLVRTHPPLFGSSSGAGVELGLSVAGDGCSSVTVCGAAP